MLHMTVYEVSEAVEQKIKSIRCYILVIRGLNPIYSTSSVVALLLLSSAHGADMVGGNHSCAAEWMQTVNVHRQVADHWPLAAFIDGRLSRVLGTAVDRKCFRIPRVPRNVKTPHVSQRIPGTKLKPRAMVFQKVSSSLCEGSTNIVR